MLKKFLSTHTFSMLVLIRIIVLTYVLAVNVYGYTLIYFQKKHVEEHSVSTIKDGKLFVAGLIGGAAGIYLGMFLNSYRLHNMFLMIVMPILIVLNVYLLITGFVTNFGFITEV